ncbi:MAG: TRAP transporter small permease [Rhodobacteraceae bacterium]|nr:TRAP transporter small permease [Paracoccaceae bacterium]
MLTWLERVVTPIFIAMAVLAAIAASAIILLIGASVTMRYLAFTPLRFTEELVGLLMTAAFFLALPLVTLRAEHVRVQILVAPLTGPTRWRVNLLAGLLGAGFCLWFFALCLPWFEFAYMRGIKTEVGRLLMYPWMALLPVSMFLTALAFVIRGGIGTGRPGTAASPAGETP